MKWIKEATSKTFTVSFGECEHSGDLSRYVDDLKQSGANILDTDINEDTEEGYVKIEVPDFESFLKKFEGTSGYQFSNLEGYGKKNEPKPDQKGYRISFPSVDAGVYKFQLVPRSNNDLSLSDKYPMEYKLFDNSDIPHVKVPILFDTQSDAQKYIDKMLSRVQETLDGEYERYSYKMQFDPSLRVIHIEPYQKLMDHIKKFTIDYVVYNNEGRRIK